MELLISEIRIVNRRDAARVSIPQHPPEFLSGHRYAARYDERGVAEINETDLPTRVDTPAVTQLGRQTGLSPMRHPGVGCRGHVRIVTNSKLQSEPSYPLVDEAA